MAATTVASCEAVDLSGTDTTAHKAACEALQTTAIDPVGGNMCLYTYARGSCQVRFFDRNSRRFSTICR